jgi:hypothetical protein
MTVGGGRWGGKRGGGIWHGRELTGISILKYLSDISYKTICILELFTITDKTIQKIFSSVFKQKTSNSTIIGEL